MTSKADYTQDEWERLRRAPLVGGMAISIADPGGPIELAKETMASMRAAVTPPRQEELLMAVAQDLMAVLQQKENPMTGFKVENAALAGQQILDELREVDRIVKAKATPQESDAFREWLLTVAQAAADAAKEGGFLGFGAEQVSKGEHAMLEQLRSVFA
jgi:hypothetical protein